MDHVEIIKKLGGVDAVALAVGYGKSTVTGWRDRNSIPARVWLEIINMPGAKKAGVTLLALAQSVKGREK